MKFHQNINNDTQISNGEGMLSNDIINEFLSNDFDPNTPFSSLVAITKNNNQKAISINSKTERSEVLVIVDDIVKVITDSFNDFVIPRLRLGFNYLLYSDNNLEKLND